MGAPTTARPSRNDTTTRRQGVHPNSKVNDFDGAAEEPTRAAHDRTSEGRSSLACRVTPRASAPSAAMQKEVSRVCAPKSVDVFVRAEKLHAKADESTMASSGTLPPARPAKDAARNTWIMEAWRPGANSSRARAVSASVPGPLRLSAHSPNYLHPEIRRRA